MRNYCPRISIRVTGSFLLVPVLLISLKTFICVFSSSFSSHSYFLPTLHRTLLRCEKKFTFNVGRREFFQLRLWNVHACVRLRVCRLARARLQVERDTNTINGQTDEQVKVNYSGREKKGRKTVKLKRRTMGRIENGRFFFQKLQKITSGFFFQSKVVAAYCWNPPSCCVWRHWPDSWCPLLFLLKGWSPWSSTGIFPVSLAPEDVCFSICTQ